MDEVKLAKANLRREMLVCRMELHAADRASNGARARAAAGHFLAASRHAGVEVIAGFRPIRTEIDVTPVMEALASAGHRLCVPVVQGRGQGQGAAAGEPLRFREWTPEAEAAMTTGPFGVPVPSAGAWLVPGLLLVPLLAFDAQGWRLGYGGAFYDRTLAALRARRPTLAVGFAYAGQQVPGVPHGPADQRLDAVVTEAGWMDVLGEG